MIPFNQLITDDINPIYYVAPDGTRERHASARTMEIIKKRLALRREKQPGTRAVVYSHTPPFGSPVYLDVETREPATMRKS